MRKASRLLAIGVLAATSLGLGTVSAAAETPNGPSTAAISAPADETYGYYVVTGKKGEVYVDPDKNSKLKYVLPQGRVILCSNAQQNGFHKIGTSQWIKHTDLAKIG